MKGKYLQFCLGVVAGGVLFSTTATAADYLTGGGKLLLKQWHLHC